jgi:hypothetical protein
MGLAFDAIAWMLTPTITSDHYSDSSSTLLSSPVDVVTLVAITIAITITTVTLSIHPSPYNVGLMALYLTQAPEG